MRVRERKKMDHDAYPDDYVRRILKGVYVAAQVRDSGASSTT